MADTAIWQKSKPERATAFATAFTGVVPEERKLPSLNDQLRAVRSLILQKRKEGYSVDQICAALKHPAIGITASALSVRRILAEAERKLELRRKARVGALLGRGATAAAPRSSNGASTAAAR